MTIEVHLRPEAELDLEEAAVWYEEQREGLGQEFLDEVAATFSVIADMPLLFTEVHRGTRRAVMHRFPFGVFYQADEDGALIVAVLHGSRHPRRWKSRG